MDSAFSISLMAFSPARPPESKLFSVCVCVCVILCVCVYVCRYVCVCVCVYDRNRGGGGKTPGLRATSSNQSGVLSFLKKTSVPQTVVKIA